MLAGYFVMFGDLPQVKTETLLPAVLYAYERLSHPEDKSGQWLCPLLIGWAVIAGMPEISVFLSIFGNTLVF